MPIPGPAPDDAGPSGRTFALALTATTLVALAVRAWQATRTGLWFDEIFTLWIARLDWPTLIATVARDVHPPLHFAIVKLWRALGGEASAWIKLSSVLPGAALVAAIGLLGRSMFGARTGLFAAALTALHGQLVMNSQEARPYVWLTLAVWLAALFAWRWVREPRAASAIGLVLAEALGLWSHYLAGLVFVALFVWGVLAVGRQPRRIAHWLGLHLVVALVFAPQVPTFLAQLRHSRTEHWIRHVEWSDLLSLARHTAFASMVLLVPFVLLAALPLARPRQRAGAVCIVTLTVPPVILAFLVTLGGGNLFVERYMTWIIPGLCLLAAAGLAGLRLRWLAWALTLAFLAQGARVIAQSPAPEARDEAAAQRWLEAHVRPGDAIVCADSHSWLYLRHHSATLPEPVLLWPAGPFPYYEGSLVIPRTALHGAGAIDSLDARGVRWWAVRSAHGGIDSAPALALIERADGRVVMTVGDTRVFESPAASGVTR